MSKPKKSSSETNVDQPERIIAGKDKALKERDTRTRIYFSRTRITYRN